MGTLCLPYCSNIYTYFSKVYPMDSNSKYGDALKLFCQQFGVPEMLNFDGYNEQACNGTKSMK